VYITSASERFKCANNRAIARPVFASAVHDELSLKLKLAESEICCWFGKFYVHGIVLLASSANSMRIVVLLTKTKTKTLFKQ